VLSELRTPFDGAAFYCHLKEEHIKAFSAKVNALGGTWRGVQVIRNPVEMVTSAYVYHLHQVVDCDGCACHLFENLSVAEGLKMQAACTKKDVLEMMKVYESKEDLLTLRLEDFMSSSGSFDEQIKALFDHFGGDVHSAKMALLAKDASNYDLRRNPEPPGSQIGGGPHTASFASKEIIRTAWDTVKDMDVFKELQHYAEQLGYDSVGL
jgi:hypothetical protein